MNQKFLIVIFLAVLVGGTHAAKKKADKRNFYESPIWKQSVAYDAPILEAEKTLELLKQLKPLIPKNTNHYYSLSGPVSLKHMRHDVVGDDWTSNEINGIMRDDLQLLIDLAQEDEQYTCDPNFLIYFKKYTDDPLHVNHLTSIDGRNAYGRNIQAYVKHYEMEAIKKCARGTHNSK